LAGELMYEGNPKHKEPWQPGRKGSLCPRELGERAQVLLSESEPFEDKRYGVYEGKPYCAQEHGNGRWHGYPVGWKEVPEPIRRQWRRQGRVAGKDIRRYWDTEKHQ